MFLSTFLSFVLAGKLKGRKYVMLIFAVIVLVSFFSAFGWITIHEYEEFPLRTIKYYRLHPVPLSFPFYASTSLQLPIRLINYPPTLSLFNLTKIIYKIDFLTFEIISINTYYSSFTLEIASLCYSFFLVVNTIGAFIGHWIGKSTILARAEKRGGWLFAFSCARVWVKI
jgi:hypothetical protein